jgi:transaldolase
MRPANLKTRIFLDSGDPAETKAALGLLGFLDGQTTNPTLVSRHPHARERLAQGKKFTREEVYDFYRQVVGEVSALIPDGSVSIEVYADGSTTAEQMLGEGKRMSGWIPNAHIKYPTTEAGLTAAEQSIRKGLRVNMTLCFSQAQAAAVYAATRGAAANQAYVSPFIGRLDDLGEQGMDVIANIMRMYAAGDGHTEVLAASIRTQEHFMRSLALGADIITAPFSTLKAWAEAGLPVPTADSAPEDTSLRPIPYQELDLSQPWQSFDIKHQLTDKGIARFTEDWNALISG